MLKLFHRLSVQLFITSKQHQSNYTKHEYFYGKYANRNLHILIAYVASAIQLIILKIVSQVLSVLLAVSASAMSYAYGGYGGYGGGLGGGEEYVSSINYLFVC